MRSRRRVLGLLAVILAASCSRGPVSIDISPKKVKIYGIERSQRLTARLLNKKGQPVEGTPSWSSSNSAIVEAEPGGRLVAKKAGRATVTATYEGITGQVPVEIVDVSVIEMAPPALSLIGPVGASVPISCTVKDSHQNPVDIKVTWISSNPKVATISDQGIVTSVGPGTTTIVAKVGDIQGGCDVTVTVRPIARLELRPATALVRVGETQHFTVTAYGPDGIAIPEVAALFRSSDPAVASVDSAGVASGRRTGAATIRAELAGSFAEATLLVN